MPQSNSKKYQLSPSTTLNVISSGIQESSNPTLIFLHFWGGSSSTFTSVTSQISPKLHTLAIDFRGWGSSTGPQSSGEYSIKDLASDIEILIPELDIHDFILIGHSMGGKVAQFIAGRNLVRGLKGVVLIATAPPTPLSLPPDMKKQQIIAYSTRQSAEYVTRNVLSSSSLSDEVVSLVVEDMLKGNEFAVKAWPEYAMGEDILAEVKRIIVPVLVIAGELDRVEPVERLKAEVLGNIKGAEMVIVEDSGHLLPLEASEKVAHHILQFVGNFA